MEMSVMDRPGGPPAEPPGNEAAKALLLADLEYFAECEWRNEEIGEKRFNFFMTLVTAIEGGLGALASHRSSIQTRWLSLLHGRTWVSCCLA
jgi:hypothetical protein